MPSTDALVEWEFRLRVVSYLRAHACSGAAASVRAPGAFLASLADRIERGPYGWRPFAGDDLPCPAHGPDGDDPPGGWQSLCRDCL